MDKPFLFLENLLEILPLCLSEDEEINILGKELLDTYDCCLFPLTIYILYGGDKIPFPILSSKSEEDFLGEIACEAYKQGVYFAIEYHVKEPLYIKWWFYPKDMLQKALNKYNNYEM
jgi:hypothetical protein